MYLIEGFTRGQHKATIKYIVHNEDLEQFVENLLKRGWKKKSENRWEKQEKGSHVRHMLDISEIDCLSLYLLFQDEEFFGKLINK